MAMAMASSGKVIVDLGVHVAFRNSDDSTAAANLRQARAQQQQQQHEAR